MSFLSDDLLNRYNRQVPRYTSYPPATRFEKNVPEGLYDSWLEQAGQNISLYIHIPFCMKLCYYCGCHMKVVNSYDPIHEYLQTLKKEVRLLKKRLPSDCRITYIHFGGGSPTSVNPKDFTDFMEFLRKEFDISNNAEIGLEADPRNMSEGRILAYALNGVNRISLGVQDFDQKVLEAINRPQPFQLTENAMALCRSYGINQINFDLMYGLPYQTSDSISKTIQKAVDLKPERIAFFGYAHVPWMKKHMDLIPEEASPDFLTRYSLYKTGEGILIDAGYMPVGLDHFVLPRDAMALSLGNRTLRRNFQGYTVDSADTLVGIGASSIGEFRNGYIQNETDIRLYAEAIERGSFGVMKSLLYAENDQVYKYVIEKIMCYLSVDLDEVERRFGLQSNFFATEILALKPLEDDGIVRVSGKTVTINGIARPLTRIVCEVFDRYAQKMDGTVKRHAMAI